MPIKPTALFERESRFIVATFGGGQFISPRNAADNWRRTCTRQRHAHEVHSRPDETWEGFKCVLEASTNFNVDADGIVVPPDTAVSIMSNDCAIVVACNRQTGKLAITHTGRAALTGSSEACPSCNFTVLSQLFSRVAPQGSDCSQVEIYVTASICGHCFQHEQPTAQSKLDFFRRHYPSAIVDEYGLDQFTVIKEVAISRGVLPEHIHHDQCCTKENRQFSSLRAGEHNGNVVVVVNLQT